MCARSAADAGVEHRAEVAMRLGHPQSDVGRSGDDRGVGAGRERRGECVLRRGRDPALPGRQVLEGAATPECGEPTGDRTFVTAHAESAFRGDARRAPVIRCRQVVHAFRRVEDRPVAGAAAQVARQRVAHRLPIGPAGVLVEPEQAHHEAGRAEAALRAVALDHRLLHRMQRVGRGEALHRVDGLAVHGRQQADAGVDAIPREAIASRFGDRHRARAAVALGAAFLRAGELSVLAQPREQGGLRRHALDLDGRAVQQEAQRAGAGIGHCSGEARAGGASVGISASSRPSPPLSIGREIPR